MGGAASGISPALACDWRTLSSPSVRGAWAAAAAHVVTCEGGEARASGGGGGSVSGTRVEVGLSESPPAASARPCLPASESPASPRRRSPLPATPVGRPPPPPPRPRGAFRWACTRPLPAAPRRSSRDEFFHLFRDEPGIRRCSRPRRRRERARPVSELGDGSGGRGEGGRRGAVSRYPGWVGEEPPAAAAL